MPIILISTTDLSKIILRLNTAVWPPGEQYNDL